MSDHWRKHEKNHPYLKNFEFFCDIHGFAVYKSKEFETYDIVCDEEDFDRIYNYFVKEFLEIDGEWFVLGP